MSTFNEGEVRFAVKIDDATSKEVLELLAGELRLQYRPHQLRTDRLHPNPVMGIYATYDRPVL